MKSKKSKKITVACLVLAGIFLLVSCVSSTNVTFYTDVEGAEVYIDGEFIGKTPVMAELSNAIWEDPSVMIKKDGYKTITTELNKEIKIVNVILGVCIDWPAYLWCYGPKANQTYVLIPTSGKM